MGVLMKFASTILLCMIMGAYVTEAAITCGTVTGKLAPCIPYATGRATAPSGGCCGGVKTLNSAATTTSDRQAVCKCLKSVGGTIPGVNYNIVGGIPGKCGVNVPFKISPSTNCDSVK